MDPATHPPDRDPDWDLARLSAALRGGRRLIFACALAAALVSVAFSLLDRARYRAAAILAVARPDAVLAFDPRFTAVEPNPSFPFRVNSLRVYSELLESDGIAREVAPALEAAGYQGSLDPQDLLGAVDIEALADGALIRVEAWGARPADAALLANTWAEVFQARMTALYGAEGEGAAAAARDQAASELQAAEDALAAGYEDEGLDSRDARWRALAAAQRRREDGLESLAVAEADLAAVRASGLTGRELQLASLAAAGALGARDAISGSRALQLQLQLGDGLPSPENLAALAEALAARREGMAAEIRAGATALDAARRDLALAQGRLNQRFRQRDLAAERYTTLARKADELDVEAATQRPELRIAASAAEDDRLPWGLYLTRLLAATVMGALGGMVWLAFRPP